MEEPFASGPQRPGQFGCDPHECTADGNATKRQLAGWASFRHDVRLILILACVAAGIRVWLICNTEVAARDSIGYIRYAVELERESWPEVFRHSLQHPGYPFAILAVSKPVCYLMGGISPVSMQVSAQIASALASILLVIPTFYLGRELVERKAAFWATLLFQCLPVATRVMSDGLSEATFFLFLASALLCGVRALHSPSLLRFAGCGLLGGLAYLTRPEGVIVILAVGLVLVGMKIFGGCRESWRRVVLCGAGLTLTALLVGGPFAVMIGGFSPKPTASKLIGARSESKESPLPIPERPTARHTTRGPLLAVYAPTTTQKRTWWAFEAIGIELVRGFDYVLCAPLLVGLILLRQRLSSSPAAWLLLSLCGIHSLVLWRLADVMGYVSDRHVLLLVFCGIYPTAAGSIAISNWLASAVGTFWLRHRTGAAASARLVPRLAMIFLFAMTAFALPEVLKPMHTNRSGHRQAGLWLAEHADPADVVLDPYCWAHYYAGRVFLEGTAPAARSMQVNYVVVEHADHEHVRLVGLEKAVEFASFGRPVYHWPEKKSVENAKVVVYAVTQADIDRVNQRTQAQAVKRTKAR